MQIKLREIRESLGMSQSKLARLSGVNRMTINLIENGKNENSKIGTLLALSKVLGCDVSNFFTLDA